MEKGLTKLCKISLILRNQSKLSNSAIAIRHISQNCCSFNKENTELINKEIEEHKSYIFPKEVRSILNTQSLYASNKHDLMYILSVLCQERKKMHNNYDILRDENFILLCEQLQKCLRTLNATEALRIFKALITLNVPTKTMIMQLLLKILKNYLNEMNCQELTFFMVQLKQCQSTPLSDALTIALPIVIYNHIRSKLNHEDLISLSTALWYLRGINDTATINSICNSILKQKFNMNTKSASFIHNSLCHLDILSDSMKELLSVTYEFIMSNASSFHPNEVNGFLRQIAYKVQQRDMRFFNDSLVKELVNAALFHNVQLSQIYRIVSSLNMINYIHVPLIEHLQTHTVNATSFLCSPLWMADFLFALSLADYRTDTIDIIYKEVQSETFKKICPNWLFLKIAVTLASFDLFNSNIIGHAFVTNQKYELMQNKIDNCLHLVHLYQSVKTLFPQYDGPWPDEDTLTYAYNNMIHSSQLELKRVLTKALGGSQYVIHNLETKLYHFVDHVIIMRKGGYPIAIQQSMTTNITTNKYVEDLVLPSESEGIIILTLPQRGFSINTQRMINTWSLKVKSLEKLTGFRCIVINPHIYNSLMEHEKIPYLMRKITSTSVLSK